MKEALMYAGAFVVALLLIWLLPLGFSRLGGLMAVAVALLAAIMADMASSVIPLWQTAALVLVLLAAASLLLDRRLGAILYRRNDFRETSFQGEKDKEANGHGGSPAGSVFSAAPLAAAHLHQPRLSAEPDGLPPKLEERKTEGAPSSPIDSFGEAAEEGEPFLEPLKDVEPSSGEAAPASPADEPLEQAMILRREEGEAAFEPLRPAEETAVSSRADGWMEAAEEAVPLSEFAASGVESVEPLRPAEETAVSSRADRWMEAADEAVPLSEFAASGVESVEPLRPAEETAVSSRADRWMEAADEAVPLSEFAASGVESVEPLRPAEETAVSSRADRWMEAADEAVPLSEFAASGVESVEPLRRVADWLDEWPGAVTPELEAAVLRKQENDPQEALLLKVDIDGWGDEVGPDFEEARSDSMALLGDVRHDGEEHRKAGAAGGDDGATDDLLEIGEQDADCAAGGAGALAGGSAAVSLAAEAAAVSEHSAAEPSPPAPMAGDDRSAEEERPALTALPRMVSEKAQLAAAELRLSRSQLTSEAYERCLHQCLQAPLTDRDYYVFARLLLEHYVLERRAEPLAAWLDQLERRFSPYPAIAAELRLWREMAATLGRSLR
ncbi:hypothetical protein ACPVTF_13490 [Geobacillus icigianus]|uniref:Uncharacterized protein n=1 Tax=Geobacillus subterraneus TaxID=129338 RepID=A0A679FNL0_9BACL|nr:hypothetical protein [Geobacillus subterraneus]BBW95406.1 hypothetical protein GsuE55_02390 [Geobacillus subterraneus]